MGPASFCVRHRRKRTQKKIDVSETEMALESGYVCNQLVDQLRVMVAHIIDHLPACFGDLVAGEAAGTKRGSGFEKRTHLFASHIIHQSRQRTHNAARACCKYIVGAGELLGIRQACEDLVADFRCAVLQNGKHRASQLFCKLRIDVDLGGDTINERLNRHENSKFLAPARGGSNRSRRANPMASTTNHSQVTRRLVRRIGVQGPPMVHRRQCMRRGFVGVR
nr:MAG TPA: hypothetical protein [Caudoviricetes sp.]